MTIKEGFVVCTTTMKEKILRNISNIKNYIFLTLEELQQNLKFSIKKNAVFHLMKHYGISYSLSIEYLKALYFITDCQYNHPKLDSIVSVFRYLKEHDFLIFHPLFHVRLKQFPLTFIYPEPTKEYENIKALVKKHTNIYEIYPEDTHFIPEVYEFRTSKEECLFVMNKIKDLLRKKVSPQKIYIIYTDKEYLFLLKRLVNSYHIQIQFSGYQNLLSNLFIKEFLFQCEKESTFETILQKLDSKNSLYSVVLNFLNDYELIVENPKDCIEFLKSSFKMMNYPKTIYLEAIQTLSSPILFSSDDYVFYLGFQLGDAPKIIKEDGFLNDVDLKKLNQSTSFERNNYEYEKLKQWIYSTKNLVLTYKNRNKTENAFPSFLIEDLCLNVKKNVEVSYGYSMIEDELRLVELLDLYEKYGQWHNDLELYGIGKSQYKTFQHQYKLLSAECVNSHFNKYPLRLSYSTIKLYFACPFSFFADRVLGLNEFKPQLAARLGSFSHRVLEESYAENFNFLTSIEQAKKEHALDAKDEFFFDQMVSVLANLISFNRQNESNFSLKEIKQEVHIQVEKDNYLFEGYIDKLMYKIEQNDVYVAIVDYKTGSDVVSLDNIEDGFHLQLPSYMYLLSYYEPFKNKNLHILGVYLQKVNVVLFDDKTDIEKQNAKRFMLEGYSVANIELLELLDPTYQQSTYIKSLRLGKEGFYKYSKIFLEEEQTKIISIMETLIDKASNEIRSGKFEIQPKNINGKNASCIFCQYKDICFSDYEDVIELSYKPFRKDGGDNGMDIETTSSDF